MTTETPALADDLLDGAEEIAAFLGGKWNSNRVYIAKNRRTLPIRSRPGLGVYALKSELRAFFTDPASLPEAAA